LIAKACLNMPDTLTALPVAGTPLRLMTILLKAEAAKAHDCGGADDPSPDRHGLAVIKAWMPEEFVDFDDRRRLETGSRVGCAAMEEIVGDQGTNDDDKPTSIALTR